METNKLGNNHGGVHNGIRELEQQLSEITFERFERAAGVSMAFSGNSRLLLHGGTDVYNGEKNNTFRFYCIVSSAHNMIYL